jgi:transposase
MNIKQRIEARDAKIVALSSAGESYQAIAEKLVISVSTVYAVLRRVGKTRRQTETIETETQGEQ